MERGLRRICLSRLRAPEIVSRRSLECVQEHLTSAVALTLIVLPVSAGQYHHTSPNHLLIAITEAV